VQFRLFFEIPLGECRTLFLLEFLYEEEVDWYEVKVSLGQEIVGYVHGYANRGWAPQVNNIWVSERLRRRGIATVMMTKIEDYFGQVPLPATPIGDNEAARAFWRKYLKINSLRRKDTGPDKK